MRKFTCPSGAILQINAAPFAQAKALYQALLREARGIQFSSKMELSALYKDLFCVGFSSPEIERALWECMELCTYNYNGKGDLKIDKDSFEPVGARDDYMVVCMEVTKENVLPFVKSLYAEYKNFMGMIDNILA